MAAPAKGAATDEVYAKFDEIDPQRSDGTGKILHAMSFELNPYDFLSNSLLPAATALVPEIEDVLTKLSATSTMVNMTGQRLCGIFTPFTKRIRRRSRYFKNIKKNFLSSSACHLRGQRKGSKIKANKNPRFPQDCFRTDCGEGFLFVVYDKRENIFRRLKCRDMRRNGVF